MSKKFPIYILIAMMMAMVSNSCKDNNSTTDSSEDILLSGVGITKFSLQSNKNVLSNLDSVFFTIDLEKGLIYNADSLPKGTDVSHLCVTMTYGTCSSAQFNVKNGTVMNDTTFAYSTSDSIDFTGDVTFTMVSQDLSMKKTYTIKVNVHQMEPDSLYWNNLERTNLPAANPVAQKTVKLGDNVVTLVKETDSYTLATTTNPYESDWTKETVALPFTPQILSLTATDDALYVLAENGDLFKSADGKNWTATGENWYSISGYYGTSLLGVTKAGDVYSHAMYPASADFVASEVEDGFPVSGTSSMISLNSKWQISGQNIMIGGVDSKGNIVGSTWGYDGFNWGKVSNKDIAAHKGMVLIAYYTYDVATTNWEVSKYPTLLAFGGALTDGTMDKTVYSSRDNGVTWAKADSLLQLPEYIPAAENAQALVLNSTLTVNKNRSVNGWTAIPSLPLPAWFSIAEYAPMGKSRATEPVTSWECPYIYVFGGTDANGTLYNNVWRGVLNRLSFKPIY